MEEKYKPLEKNNYNDNYFQRRMGNDEKRNVQFKLDKKFINKKIQKGIICDIGCSTGEFIESLNWNGEKYGMEVNEYAIRIAQNKKISFSKNIFNQKEYFDLVIFRGTIQHIDEPFRFIKETYNSLKKGGYICFLSTPNTNSLLYKIKNNLGMLDEKVNFFIPNDIGLKNALINYGFNEVEIEYPYLKTPYCNIIDDHLKFIKNIFSKNFKPHPFWKSSMNIIGKK